MAATSDAQGRHVDREKIRMTSELDTRENSICSLMHRAAAPTQIHFRGTPSPAGGNI